MTIGALLLLALGSCTEQPAEQTDLEIAQRLNASNATVYISPGLTLPLERPGTLRGEIETWSFLGGSSDPLGPWKYVGPDMNFGPVDGLTIAKVGVEALEQLLLEGRAMPRLTLQMDERLAQFDTVELEILVRQSCTAEVALHFANGEEITRPFKLPGSPGMQTVTLPIGWLERSWDGLFELEIRPDTDLPQELRLSTIRLLRNGLALGPEAQESLVIGTCGFGGVDENDEPEDLHLDDIGLVGPGRELVRGHAQQQGASLTTSLYNFGKTRVSVAVIPGWQAHRDKGKWHAAMIEFGEDGDRKVLAQIDVDLDAEEGLPHWRTLECEVPKTRPEFKELHLFAWSGDGEVPEFFRVIALPYNEAPRCAAIWGAPFQVDSGATNTRPNIVLVTLDTTRADLAYDPDTAPFLAKLRREGTSFERAWSAANTTAPAHASLFTARPVHEHGTFTNGVYPLDRELITLAEYLRDRGYRTIGAANVEHLGSRFQFGQGFDVFLDPPSSEIAVDGADTLAMLAPWLDQLQGESGGPPFFLWVHLFDAHVPYRVPSAFEPELESRGLGLPEMTVANGDLPVLRKTPRHMTWLDPKVNHAAHLAALYRQGVAYADHLTGKLHQGLKSRDLLQNSIFTVTADHGESLGEQDFWATHASIYPAVQRIPLILHGTGIPHRVEALANVSSLDVARTLVRLAGATPQADWQGTDLLNSDFSAEELAVDREIWFESQTLAQIGRVQGQSLFISNIADVNMGLRKATPDELAQRPFTHYAATYAKDDFELYDMASDPVLLNNLRVETPDVAEALNLRARAALKAGLEERVDASAGGLTPRERERLSALGYTDL